MCMCMCMPTNHKYLLEVSLFDSDCLMLPGPKCAHCAYLTMYRREGREAGRERERERN